MAPAVIYEARQLPDEPLAASAGFYAEHLARVEQAIASGPQSIVLVFDPGDHTQRDWRLAALHSLARKYAPVRVNGVAGTPDTVGPLLTYLEDAPGVTGQLLDAA